MPKIIEEKLCIQIKKCYGYFKNDRPDLTISQLIIRIVDLFEVSRSAVYKILGLDDTKNCCTNKVTDQPTKTILSSNYIFRENLQRLIWQYNLKNEHWTLDRLLTDASDSLEYGGSKTTLHKIIKSMGYKYRYVNGRKILCEQKHVVAAKITFLRKFLQFKNSNENLTFVYLDETWIYQNGSAVRRWVHESDLKSNPSKIRNEGKRFTILHAGTCFGFLEGCDMLLDSRSNDRDYHKMMNAQIFQNWVIRQLIPALDKLQSKCVVVMDNAPYHLVQLDKPPTFSCQKGQMREWLINHNVEIEGKNTKKELWELIKPFRLNGKKCYVIDNILKDHGHVVLRLLPYHCQYNPIEMAWGFSKTYYNKHINSQPLSKDRVANLWRESLSKCTSGMWQNFCKHCEKLILDDWTRNMGKLSVENIPPIIISLEESDTELSNDDDDDGFDSSDEIMEVE